MTTESVQEQRRKKRSRRALKTARAHMADPAAKLPRLLTAYTQLKAKGTTRLDLPEA